MASIGATGGKKAAISMTALSGKQILRNKDFLFWYVISLLGRKKGYIILIAFLSPRRFDLGTSYIINI
ncbi:hypothetical protein J1N35_040077 [Gossypium stocksii]|uniref:Uncharacterized protein n=1 Tax=Gossypium stocksii TaxID=47602 RepID=A0A9D3UDI7_9ROSI|nr:hypothetical protein J1N35_040077 [Gossypium stocksii]